MQVPPIEVNIDFSGLADLIVGALGNALRSFFEPMPAAFMDWLNAGIGEFWNALWDSGANLLATPYALTIDFPPARLLGANLFGLVSAIMLLALVLLCFRNVWGVMGGSGSAMHDTVNNILTGILLAGSSTVIVAQAFYLTGLLSDAMGRIDYRPSIEPQNLLSFGPSLIIGLFTIIVMLVYGWRLMVRAAYRIVLLMFLAPFAPVAGAIWAIPQLRWVSVFYWTTMGGWLVGGALAIGAISLGVHLALNNTNGLLNLIFGVALVQIAYDLMSILTRGGGTMGIPSPFSIMLGAAAGGFAGSFAGGAAGGAAGSAAASGGGFGAVAAGALPSGRDDGPGYGY